MPFFAKYTKSLRTVAPARLVPVRSRTMVAVPEKQSQGELGRDFTRTPNEFVAVYIAVAVTTKDTNYVNIHITRAPGCMRSKREMNFVNSISH